MSYGAQRLRGFSASQLSLRGCLTLAAMATLALGCGSGDAPGSGDDTPPTEPDIPSTGPDISPTEPDIPSTGPDLTSTEPDIASTEPDIPSEVVVSELSNGSFACTPAGLGPFPGVLYNHGGLAMAVGGDLEGTCQALAEAGYVGYSKQRRLTESPSIMGHIDDVYEGLDALLAMDGVDTERIGIMGFSRGGLLTLQAATERPDTFSAVVSMAPASAKGKLDLVLADADKIDAPVLVLVSINDLFQDDHVALAADVVAALEEAGAPHEHIVYDAFGDDGHERFFTVGGYWEDVTAFLGTNL